MGHCRLSNALNLSAETLCLTHLYKKVDKGEIQSYQHSQEQVKYGWLNAGRRKEMNFELQLSRTCNESTDCICIV